MKQQILYHHVIETRKPQLDSIRDGFLISPAAKYALEHVRTLKYSRIPPTGFLDDIFPKFSTTEIPAGLVLEKLEVHGDENDNVDRMITEYVLDLAQGIYSPLTGASQIKIKPMLR